MNRFVVLLCFFCHIHLLMGQDVLTVSGTILEAYTNTPLKHVQGTIENTSLSTQTGEHGSFRFVMLLGSYTVVIQAKGYLVKRIPIVIDVGALDLATLHIEKDITTEKTDNLITLTDTEVFDDERIAISSGLLQATRDIYLTRAAFDFGQAFFRVRGYGSEQGTVLLNGIAMNNFNDGRPQWNNWGGLNDVTRNQELTYGLQASEYAFGGVLGSTNINLDPAAFRPGVRLSSSASNRTYTSRLMATYTQQHGGLSYSVSASARQAQQGYIAGTLYDSYSVFGALAYQINPKNNIQLTGIWAANHRGRSSAITKEVFELAGSGYNPYWGRQQGEIRNARTRQIQEPILLFNYGYASKVFSLHIGIGYQWGTQKRSRLSYFNAPNPDPTYYRYLPSFYINSTIGANFISANAARDAFLARPQISWEQLYAANQNNSTTGEAVYLLSNDVMEGQELSLNARGEIALSERFKIQFGTQYRDMVSQNYAAIEDLLGATFHNDIDPFSNTRNNTEEGPMRFKGDRFGYNYGITAQELNSFLQIQTQGNNWEAFLSGNHALTTYQREGFYTNERFLDNSQGLGAKTSFDNVSVKGGVNYNITGRHRIRMHGAYQNKAPTVQNTFINPRDNNNVVPNIFSETITATDFSYLMRLPKWNARLTAYYTRFQNTTDINFFFVDAGVGSDFVQEVVSDLDKLHKGVEMGVTYKASAAVKLSAVAAIGSFTYASDPSITINFDPTSREDVPISPTGTVSLSTASLKGNRLAQGPQTALSFGLEYRNPKYWWLGVTANYLANNYAHLSTINRTQSFLLDPDTQLPFPEATPENVDRLLAQQPLDNFYLLNLVGGKSWLWGEKYVSVFGSVNNVFDTVFRTGGFEQSRNGNYGQLVNDTASGTPSFAPKFWYGFGRTFFVNLAVSF